MALIGTMKYLTIGDQTYEIAGDELQIASASTLGGIKVGSGLSIDATTGVLSTSITESDPVFSASAAAGITSTDISNWNAKSDTDEKLKWTASTSSNTYYPLQSTSTATTSTANTLNGINFYQYYNTAGGYRRLNLGNSTAWKSTGGAYGTIRLYGAAATYYGDLVPGVLGTTSGDGHISANRTWTLPDKTGTIALTSDLKGLTFAMDTTDTKKLNITYS